MASLASVTLSRDVYLSCVSHAFSTEKEEIMGLLLGDTVEKEDGIHLSIWASKVLPRSDKQKDRVEIPTVELSVAAEEAEKYSELIGKTTRVIGWYHSHPHITVHPSHVDVKTQRMFQNLDKGFVGLIFSVFNDLAGMLAECN